MERTELAGADWVLPPQDAAALGPYGDFPRLSDEEKAAVWAAHRAGRPTRVPVTLAINDRVFLLDPQANVERLTYAQVFSDARQMLRAQLRIGHLVRQRYHLFSDHETALPEVWRVGPFFHNVYEAAALGAVVHFPADDVPSTVPPLGADTKRAVFDVDLDKPLECGVYARGIAMTHALRDYVADKTCFGRPIEVLPYAELGSDGPLTGALNLLGELVLRDLRRDPAYVHELFAWLTEAGLARVRAFRAYWDLPASEQVWLADDSVAMLSVAQYREFVLPYHQRWYDALDPDRSRVRGMHLCGDATRHFPTIAGELGVRVFDTGFPVDFAALRAALGPEVELVGGVEVPLLLSGTPEAVYARAREILTSGVMAGGRFVLREANNLPPGVPWTNLAAMYRAAHDFGCYE